MRVATRPAVHTWWDLVIDLGMAQTPEWDAVEDEEGLLLSRRLATWSDKYPGGTT